MASKKIVDRQFKLKSMYSPLNNDGMFGVPGRFVFSQQQVYILELADLEPVARKHVKSAKTQAVRRNLH